MKPSLSFLVVLAHVVLVSGVIRQQPSESDAKTALQARRNATLSDFGAVKQAPAGPVVRKPRLLPIPVSDARPTVENSPTAPSAVNPIDWSLVKILLGALLLAPAVPAILRWDMSGHPPHPFLLSENAVTWPVWLYDLVQHSAIVGVDLILLGCVEYDWRRTMLYTSILFAIRAVLGFAAFTYSVTNKHSPYGKHSWDNCFGADNGALEITNKFQDIGTSLVHLVVLLLAQMTFFTFFVGEMMHPAAMTPSAYKYWAAAIPMQIISRNLMGRSFCNEIQFWNLLFHASAEAGTQLQREFGGKTITIAANPVRICIRALMSFYVNNISMSLVAITLPLFMMTAPTDIDFVKDCFAVVFITTLDDVGETMPLKVITQGAVRV